MHEAHIEYSVLYSHRSLSKGKKSEPKNYINIKAKILSQRGIPNPAITTKTKATKSHNLQAYANQQKKQRKQT